MLPCAIKLLFSSKSGEGVEGVKQQAVINPDPRNKRTACLTAFMHVSIRSQTLPPDPVALVRSKDKQGKMAAKSPEKNAGFSGGCGCVCGAGGCHRATASSCTAVAHTVCA